MSLHRTTQPVSLHNTSCSLRNLYSSTNLAAQEAFFLQFSSKTSNKPVPFNDQLENTVRSAALDEVFGKAISGNGREYIVNKEYALGTHTIGVRSISLFDINNERTNGAKKRLPGCSSR